MYNYDCNINVMHCRFIAPPVGGGGGGGCLGGPPLELGSEPGSEPRPPIYLEIE